MKGKFWTKISAAGVLLFTMAAHTQLTTSTIVGTATDATGAVVPGAQVTATNLDTHFARSVSTNEEGSYRLEFLPIGRYSVRVEAKGFAAATQPNVVLTLNAEQDLDFSLKAGGVNDSVTVTAAPPLVETSASSIGRTIQNVEVDNLPLVSRNPYDLISLAPGVQSNTNSVALGFPQYVVYINGGTDNEVGSVSYYLDGGINMTMLRNTGNVLPNPDALQEMNVLTNSYNALYGRMSSGIVNVVTKSGSNQMHGSIFEFLRNDKLNATPAFQTSKQRLRRNQFGATLGGPIIRDKTFFFGSYGGFHNNTSTGLTGANVPTNFERANGFTNYSDKLPTTSGAITSCTQTLSTADSNAGDFILCTPNATSSNAAITGANSAAKPVTNNDLSTLGAAGTPDVAALNILKNYIPAPNGTSVNGVPQWHGYVFTPQQADEFLLKIDHNLTPTQRIEAAYFMSVGYQDNNPGGNIPWVINYYPYRQQNANLSDTWTINDHKINQVWVNYTRMLGGRVNTPALSLGDLGSTYAVVGTPSLPQVTVSSAFTLSNAIAGPKAGTNFYSIRDVFSWNKGKHSLGMGGEMSLNKDIQQTLLNNYGVFAFTGTKGLRTNQGIGDFVLGLNSAVNQDIPVTAIDNSWAYGMFLQDDWKARKNLTLNMGIRWDIQTPPTDPQNRETTFVAGQKSTLAPLLPTGLLLAGDPGVTRGVVGLRLHHISPRLGFAYVPYASGKTVFRGAAGIFYGMVSGNEWNAVSNFQPFASRTSYTSSELGHFSKTYENFPGGVSPFHAINYSPSTVTSLILPNSLEGINLNYQWPYSYQMNLSVQQQFSRDFAIQIAYVGTLSHDLPMDLDVNAPQYSPTQTAANKDNRRPLFNSENIQQVYLISSGQSAHYHALELDFDKRLSHSLSIKGNYTWSKTLESASLQNTTAQNNPQNFNYINEDYGRTDNDLRHRFATAIVWQPNYFTQANFIVRGVLNGWTISTISKVQSGSPFTVSTGTDVNLDGNTNDRASLVPGVAVYTYAATRAAKEKSFFNPAAFCSAGSALTGGGICPGIGPGGLDGNSRRDNFTGPGYKNVDASLFRDFTIYERVKLQVRAESDNVFNLINLNNPNVSLNTASTVGTISGGSAARQLQLGARILF